MNKKILVFITTVAFLGNVFAKPSEDVIGSEDGSNSCSCPAQTTETCPRVTPMRCEISTPTRTATRTATATLTKTPTATRTATKTATKTPTPDSQCAYYKASTNYFYSGGAIVSKEDILTNDKESPSCFVNGIDKLYSACKKYSRGSRNTDDCVLDFLSSDADYITLPLPAGDNSFTYLKDLIKVGYNATCLGALSRAGRAKECGVRNSWRSPSAATFYFDEDCKPVPLSQIDPNKLCGAGTVNIHGSPISLLLEATYEELSANSSIVKFKLKPASGEYTEWKASEKAPLLVFDPNHTGLIESAEQLFGEWTFGGKAMASLIEGSEHNATWQNGFEALGTLDTNFDGRINGKELDDLSLWFDRNQNAKSEPGEVVSIRSSGITALYYRGSKKDLISKDVVLDFGFEREINGKVVQGAMVDWYGVTANSLAELNQRKEILSSLCSATSYNVGQDKENMLSDSNIASNPATKNPFAGSWNWKAKEGQDSQGILIFGSEVKGSQIRGVSAFSLSFDTTNENTGGASEANHIIELIGELSQTEGEISKMTFRHEGVDGSIIESRVERTPDQDKLEGATNIFAIRNGEKELISSYNWSATRKQ
jgi:hypothetical protein